MKKNLAHPPPALYNQAKQLNFEEINEAIYKIRIGACSLSNDPEAKKAMALMLNAFEMMFELYQKLWREVEAWRSADGEFNEQVRQEFREVRESYCDIKIKSQVDFI